VVIIFSLRAPDPAQDEQVLDALCEDGKRVRVRDAVRSYSLISFRLFSLLFVFFNEFLKLEAKLQPSPSPAPPFYTTCTILLNALARARQ
jgi:hypothetical protein